MEQPLYDYLNIFSIADIHGVTEECYESRVLIGQVVFTHLFNMFWEDPHQTWDGILKKKNNKKKTEE